MPSAVACCSVCRKAGTWSSRWRWPTASAPSRSPWRGAAVLGFPLIASQAGHHPLLVIDQVSDFTKQAQVVEASIFHALLGGVWRDQITAHAALAQGVDVGLLVHAQNDLVHVIRAQGHGQATAGG